MISRSFLLLSLGLATPVVAQVVPEEVHSDARGPSTMCGLTGADALDLIRQVRTSPGLSSQQVASDRFEVYASSDSMTQWVFTKAGEPAYPAITCRHVFRAADGSWMQNRNMRCDAGRAACDRLFTEFGELDERLRQSLAQ
jgi:hypothetical protein